MPHHNRLLGIQIELVPQAIQIAQVAFEAIDIHWKTARESVAALVANDDSPAALDKIFSDVMIAVAVLAGSVDDDQ